MKLLLAATALLIAVLSAQAQEEETVYRSEIPSKARSFLSNFKSPFHHAVRETDETKTTYDIVLNNKTEITFSENGLWMLIDGKGKAVPYKFLGKTIKEYLETNHADAVVTRIERCREKCNPVCKLAFSNGQILKLQFDANGTLLASNQ